MRVLALALLTACLLGSFGWCDTKFISPPDWRDDQRSLRDPEKNRRYVVGETIQLRWENDADNLRLKLVQVVHSKFQFFRLDSSDTSWEAKYDEWGIVGDGEDTVYFFELSNGKPLASSLYFNVTAPRKDDTRTVTAPANTVTISQSRPIEPGATSSTTNSTPEERNSTSNEGKSNTKSGMSQGEVAGAAVGGIVGGLLILGAIGWLVWRRMARMKSQPVDSAPVQYREQVIETKAELPGDNSVHPSEYAKSPTGIYEAP